ncbi:alpha/beta fold hydrolase [Prescottella sp. R16]|uniref:alpha/beta fold hydrolase n=1 Tax=Prescottella sp. R16 TaxID=3064529 RepID=UPI00272E1D5C|nr:alpha/beta fold hydrolase [Prescottella sp. R16]
MLIKSGDIQLNVEIRGENNGGTPVVFLHCVGGDLTNWNPQVEALADRYRVVSIDTRGHGKSEFAGEGLTLEDYAEDVRQVLDALEIDRAHVVGLSMGGMIAQAFALNAPERVAGLVLADTSSRIDEATAANLAQAGDAALGYGMGAVSDQFVPICFDATAIHEDREYVQRFREGFSSRDPRAFHAGLQAIGGLDFLDRLHQVAVPTLVLVGAADQLTPVAHSEAIAGKVSGASLVIFDGAGHLSNLDSKDEFTRELTRFLEETA